MGEESRSQDTDLETKLKLLAVVQKLAHDHAKDIPNNNCYEFGMIFGLIV